MASSRWACSSSSISRVRRSRRKRLTIRNSNDMSGGPQNAVDCGGHGLPAGFFGGELLLSGRGQFINAGAAAAVFHDPFGANPAGFLHAVERGIKRTFFGTEHVQGHVLNRGHNGVAVKARAAREDLQDQQVEGALEGIGFRHTQTSKYTYV